MKILNWLHRKVFAPYDVELDELVNELLGQTHKAEIKKNYSGSIDLKLYWLNRDEPLRMDIFYLEKELFVSEGIIKIELINKSGDIVFECTKTYSKPVKYSWRENIIQESTIEKIISLFDDYVFSYNCED